MNEQRLALRGGRLVGTDATVDLVLEGAQIASIGETAARTGRVVDLSGLQVAPGFVDVQINGGFGEDFTVDPASMWMVGERLRRFGVTAFLPTLVSTDLEAIAHASEIVAAGPPQGYRGAAVWGLHVEGPFLAQSRCGAHDVSKLRDPDPALVAGWSPATGVAMVTLAPELPGALDTIRALAARGVVVSLGHSDATYEQAQAGFDAGARAVTHLFNAMSAAAHRAPGLAAAAMADLRVTASLIVDHVHLHPGATAMAWRALGPERTMLITDAIAALASSTATSHLGSHRVSVADGAPRLAGGVLAGSVLSLDTAVRNLCDATGAGAAEAVATVTTVPASLLGRSRRIESGAPADLTILDDDLRVVGTAVAGHLDDSLVELER